MVINELIEIFFLNDPATTEIYTLSLHDALPIYQSLDKEHIAREINRLIREDHPVSPRWITDAELAAQPELVRTMSVKPPMGSGKVRLLEIDGVDLQPCGGTHVARTGEIGAIEVTKIENKGKMNRRVNLAFVGAAS